jgi:FkbM family methyltransferase
VIPIARLLGHSQRAPELLEVRRQTREWWGVTSRYLEIGQTHYPFEIPLAGNGSLSTVSPEEVRVFWHIFVRRCYHIPEGCKVIIDAGANIGVFAVWAARQTTSPRIIALEPFPSTFESLLSNIHANRMEHRIFPLRLGLAAEAGIRRIRMCAESPTRGILLQGSPQLTDQETVAIQCLSLSDLFAQERLGEVDLLKMDIEGSEWEVLLSTPPSVLRNIRHIELEYHEINAHYGYTPQNLFAHLAQAGLKLTRQEEDIHHTGIASFSRI